MTDECRIYLDNKGEIFCVVDADDYEWLSKYRWAAIRSRSRWKVYAARSTRLSGREGPQTRIYMHKEILERAGIKPPTPAHVIGDHKDGDSLNNRKRNLEWETRSGNARNLYGRKTKQPTMTTDSEIPF